MADKSLIEWTDATWNPIRGCRRTAPAGSKQSGCGNGPGEGGCYAERQAARFCGPGGAYEGLINLTANGPRWSGRVKFVAEHLADPVRWQRPRRIFVDSMSDLFFEEFSDEQIAAVFGVMAAAPHHTFQVLTKRARQRLRQWFAWVSRAARECNAGRGMSEAAFCFCLAQRETNDDRALSRTKVVEAAFAAPWPLPNVWLGVSVENQAAADERIPELLQVPAAIRFLSCEPLLGPVDLSAWLPRREPHTASPDGTDFVCSRCGCRWDHDEAHDCPPAFGGRLGWAIVGCESGPGARRCDPAWLRVLRDQCAAAGTAFFLKQAPETATPNPAMPDAYLYLITAAGPGSHLKAGGVIGAPYLDGRKHLDFPEVSRG